MLPTTDTSVVHPHEIVVLEGVAVAIGEGRLRGRSDMGEDERRAGLRCEPFQVLAVPCGQRGCEDAGLGA